MEPNHPVISSAATPTWRVRLVHAELGARVVEASCEKGGQVVAMALGEATTAEVAEDRARRRAARMLFETHPAPASAPPEKSEDAQPGTAAPPSPPDPQPSPLPSPAAQPPAAQPATSPQPATPLPQPSPPSPDASEPADWSDDLAVVEAQLERLGWDRNQESVYLERSFGRMERSGITDYQDLRLYIDALQRLSPPADPCTAPLPGQHELPPRLPSRELLIRNGNTLLRQLDWTTDQGRAFLKRHFGHTSRQALSDEQLMQFNQQLEAHQIGGGGDGSPAS